MTITVLNVLDVLILINLIFVKWGNKEHYHKPHQKGYSPPGGALGGR